MQALKTTAELEYEYLKWHGYLHLLAGILILSVTSANFLELGGVLGLIIIIASGIMFAVIYLLASWKLQGNFSFSKQAWRGTFEDEFLNMVSLKAYKVGYITVMFAFIPGALGVYNFVPLSREHLMTCFLGISAVAYGITIAVGLRKDNE
ncbi:hypothetical protein [Alishewanella sp. HL-SH05]|uniref:hypothetical protein n=1 Tax=Alishewanella sp. HL-SH05 TaxID=3461145 RepID=UPI004042DF4E